MIAIYKVVTMMPGASDAIGWQQGFDPFSVLQQGFGFIPNILRAQSALPRAIAAQTKLEEALCFRDGALPRICKERILLSIAADRRDSYCTTLNSAVLSSLGVPKGQIESLVSDYRHAGLPAADQDLLAFCHKLSCNGSSVRFEDTEALRTHGFGDEAIVEAVIITALAVYRCTLSVALVPEADFNLPLLRPRDVSAGPESTLAAAVPNAQRKEQRRWAFVPAPYLSPNEFAEFAIVQKSHGFIPNFFRAQTLRPDLLQAEVYAVGSILLPEDLLTRAQKESILLAVSAANLNSYCVAVHCNMLRGLGLSAAEADQIAVDHHLSNLSNADIALLDFAVKLGTRFSEFSREDGAKLQTLGFTQQQILESITVTALNNFANTVQMGLGIEPDFEVPPVFEDRKVKLLGPTPTLMAREDAVSLVETIQDADTELVAEVQGGNLEAFEELVRRHTHLIYRALVAILGDVADAQDAMQDTLLSAFKHIGAFEGRSKFSTWLVSIARNAALQRLRARRITESLDTVDADEDRNFRPRQIAAWQENPEQCYSRSEIRGLVERGLLELPAKYRIVVMLRDVEHLSTEDVARQLGLSVPAVKTRLLRGRLKLREWLAPYMTRTSKGVA
jgi:RNA polymerase sigma-70 factor, ECF subfamily